MDKADPIALLFGGMEKLGPGGNAHTLHALNLLPRKDFQLVVDVGCGAGRQTLVLAQALGTPIHAIDLYQPFLDDLMQRAEACGLGRLVRTHNRDMRDIADEFQAIDLLWSEGAAYNIGFADALKLWAPALAADGFLVVSELSWLEKEASEAEKTFFAACYPAMQSVPQNIALAGHLGYDLLDTYTLPRESWVDGYYDTLGPRTEALSNHPDAEVRAFAQETLQEIEIFNRSDNSYGYVFYLLQRIQ